MVNNDRIVVTTEMHPAPSAKEADAVREAVAAALVTLANCNPRGYRERTLIGIPPDELAALRIVYKDYLRLRSAGGVPVERPLIHTFPCGCIAAVNIRCVSHQTEPIPAPADVKGGE